MAVDAAEQARRAAEAAEAAARADEARRQAEAELQRHGQAMTRLGVGR